MDVFNLRKLIISDYSDYVKSFIHIKDSRIASLVEHEFNEGFLWPDPLIQLNPAFASGGSIDDLVREGCLHPLCGEIFRTDKNKENIFGNPLYLYKHQAEAIRIAQTGHSYVLTTGTGSGKSLSYIIPIVDDILKNGTGNGIKAIIVYPMNALANSQKYELEKFLSYGQKNFPVTYKRYTGQEGEKERDEIISEPPDILLTNYVMLELILTRPRDQKLFQSPSKLKFLVFDELHTYRGRQGADVGMLIRRLKNTLAPLGEKLHLQCIGTSATLAGPGTFTEQQQEVAKVATKLFGTEVKPENIIVETLTVETVNDYGEDLACPNFIKALRQDIQSKVDNFDYQSFIRRPLSIWIENTLGLEKNSEGRLVRCTPKALEGKDGLAEKLSILTAIDREVCLTAIKETLLAGYQIKKPSGKPVFAFKLHQFLSKGDTVYVSIEQAKTRSITLHGQQYAPDRGEEHIPLFPILFCRECGKEYYSVYINNADGETFFLPRSTTSAETENSGIKGYLFFSSKEDPEETPWPEKEKDQIQCLPDDWIEIDKKGCPKIKKNYKNFLPKRYFVKADGSASEVSDTDSVEAWFIPVPFRLCFSCGISYSARSSQSPRPARGRGLQFIHEVLASCCSMLLSLSVRKNAYTRYSVPMTAQP